MIDNGLVWALSALSITVIVIMVYVSIGIGLLSGVLWGVAKVLGAVVRGLHYGKR